MISEMLRRENVRILDRVEDWQRGDTCEPGAADLRRLCGTKVRR